MGRRRNQRNGGWADDKEEFGGATLTSRERILATIQGEAPDQTPVIIYPAGEHHSDAAIVKINRLGNAASSPRAVLAEILNPFGRALSTGVQLNAVLYANPTEG